MTGPHLLVASGGMNIAETEGRMARFRAMIAEVSTLIHAGRPVAWSGPDDGCGTGLLEFDSEFEATVIDTDKGPSFVFAVVSDMASGRSRSVGSVDDRRRPNLDALGLDADGAAAMMRGVVDGWMAECGHETILHRPNGLFGTTPGEAEIEEEDDATCQAATVCVQAAFGDDLPPMITVMRANPHSQARIGLEMDDGSAGRLDDDTTSALTSALRPVTRIEPGPADGGAPHATLSAWGRRTWNPERIEPIDVMRRLAAMGLDSPPEIVDLTGTNRSG